MHKLTLDGVDVMGERLAQEVSSFIMFLVCFLTICSALLYVPSTNWWRIFSMKVIEEINRRPYIKKISFVAHSVGGLVARYAIGRLYKPPKRTSKNTLQTLDDNNRGTIHGLEAVNFVTVATPHLGSRGNKQVPSNLSFVFYHHIQKWKTIYHPYMEIHANWCEK